MLLNSRICLLSCRISRRVEIASLIQSLFLLFAWQSDEPQSFFGVYDGHGGLDAAKYTEAQLHHHIANAATINSDVCMEACVKLIFTYKLTTCMTACVFKATDVRIVDMIELFNIIPPIESSHVSTSHLTHTTTACRSTP